MGKKKCEKKEYLPEGDEKFMCKKCCRLANKKSKLCKAQKNDNLVATEIKTD